MADRTVRFMIISRFEKACKDHGHQKPTLNKNKEQWAADALLESYRIDEIQEAMDHYLAINERPSWNRFVHNVDGILAAIDSKKQDDIFRAEMREKGRAWLGE
jgi:hypothetical protein